METLILENVKICNIFKEYKKNLKISQSEIQFSIQFLKYDFTNFLNPIIIIIKIHAAIKLHEIPIYKANIHTSCFKSTEQMSNIGFNYFHNLDLDFRVYKSR